MSKYASKRFWIDTTDRAVATFAQGSLGAITGDAIGLADLDVSAIAGIGGLAALVSVLSSVAFRGGESDPPAPSPSPSRRHGDA